ncbi:MAG TPA: O-antigen ligase family protein, partial [bacterium]|nr:O-antigen ligase family protein [bacterium]
MTPKMLSFRILVVGMLCLWFVLAKELGFMKSPFKLPCLAYVFFSLLATFRAVSMFECFGSEYLPHVIALSFFVILVHKLIQGNTRLVSLSILIVAVIGLLTGIYGIHQGLGFVDVFIGQRLVGAEQGPVSFMGNTNFAANYLLLALPVVSMMLLAIDGGARISLMLMPVVTSSMIYGYLKFPWALHFTLVGTVGILILCFRTPNVPKAMLYALSSITMSVYMGFTQARFANMGTMLAMGVMLAIGLYLRFIPWMCHFKFGQSKSSLPANLFTGPFLSMILVAFLLAFDLVAIRFKTDRSEMMQWGMNLSSGLFLFALLTLFLQTLRFPLSEAARAAAASDKTPLPRSTPHQNDQRNLPDVLARWQTTYRKVVLVCLVIGIIAGLAVAPRVHQAIIKVPSFVFRLECWRSAGRTIADNFFLGIGPGHFKIIHPIYTSHLENSVLGVERLARKVHNDFMAVWIEYGLGAMIAFFWFLVLIGMMLFYIFRRLDVFKTNPEVFDAQQTRYHFYLALGLVGAFVGTLFQANGESNFLQPASTIQIWFFAGLIASIYLRLRPGNGSFLDRIS